MKLAIISDIHADLIHLQKVLHAIEGLKCDRIACLGDIVGYSDHYVNMLDGRNGDACIRLVKDNCGTVICGNHDMHAVRRLPSHHQELGMPADWYRLSTAERSAEYGQQYWLYEDELEEKLSGESREFLESLPEQAIIHSREFRMLLTHFVYPDTAGNLQQSPAQRKDFLPHLKMMRKAGCFVGIAGHAHLEGYARISRNNYEMNYFRRTTLLNRRQLIIGPAVTRSSKCRSGFLVIDTSAHEFESIPLE